MKRKDGPHFHVVNGDSTLALLRKSAVPGEFLVWPDMLMEGPLPTGGGGRLDWSKRAAFLASRFGIPPRPALARMRAFEKALASAAASNGEITLWFEEDFFCQIHLVYLLAVLARPGLKARISVICPARPLGLLAPKALERLFAARRAPDPRRVALSRKVWRLLTAPWRNGKAAVAGIGEVEGRLASLIRGREAFACWPRLRRGLEVQLNRRPGAAGAAPGLGSVETALLGAIRSEANGRPRSLPFNEAFRKVVTHPRVRPLGLGDLQVARIALDLASLEGSPLRISGPGSRPRKGRPLDFRRWRLASAAA